MTENNNNSVWVAYPEAKTVVDMQPMLNLIFNTFEGPEDVEERICALIEDFVLVQASEYPNDIPEHGWLLFELRKVLNLIKKTHYEQSK